MSSDEKSLSMIQAEFKFNFIYNSEMANGKLLPFFVVAPNTFTSIATNVDQ